MKNIKNIKKISWKMKLFHLWFYRHIAEVSGGFNVDYNCLYCVYWHLYIGDSRIKVPKKNFFYWLLANVFEIHNLCVVDHNTKISNKRSSSHFKKLCDYHGSYLFQLWIEHYFSNCMLAIFIILKTSSTHF